MYKLQRQEEDDDDAASLLAETLSEWGLDQYAPAELKNRRRRLDSAASNSSLRDVSPLQSVTVHVRQSSNATEDSSFEVDAYTHTYQDAVVFAERDTRKAVPRSRRSSFETLGRSSPQPSLTRSSSSSTELLELYTRPTSPSPSSLSYLADEADASDFGAESLAIPASPSTSTFQLPHDVSYDIDAHSTTARVETAQSGRPAGKLFGRSLMDELDARKAQQRGLQRCDHGLAFVSRLHLSQSVSRR